MKYLPIKIHIAYIFITLMVSFYGPRIYLLEYDKFITSIFIASYLLVVYFGFYLGINSRIRQSTISLGRAIKQEKKILRILQKSIFWVVVIYIIYLIYLISTGRLNLNFSSLGRNYGNFYDYYRQKSGENIFTFELLFLVISAIPKYISLVLGFLYFKQLKKKYKWMFCSLIVLIIVTQTLAAGNQKSIGDVVIVGGLALILWASKLPKPKRKKILKRTAIIMLTTFALFSYMQFARLSSRDISLVEINNHMSGSYFDADHWIFKVFGHELGLGIAAFTTGYLSGGYYGLSLCLQLPFEWSYGIGNSVALSSLAENFLGIDVYSHTYLYRMEEVFGIPGKRQWHTIFPWMASDFSFPGAILIFFFFSYLYGRTWKEVLKFRNPYSYLLFTLLTIMFVFVPANNQIFHGYDYFIITVTVFILYFLRHRSYSNIVIVTN